MFARLASKFTVAFSTGWDFFRPRKKLGIVSFILLSSLVVVFFFATTKVVNAVDILPSAGDIMKWFAEILLALAGFCIKLTFFVLKFIIEVAGYNGFIDSPAVIVGWVMIRDITNMLFVVVLLAIAFGTILGIDSYEYKHSLVKLIGAAILVNFSRVICGLIIDIAQVIMITFVNGIAATASGNLLNMFQVDQIFKMSAGGSTTGTPAATFLAGVAALTFSVIMLVTMLAFLFMITARMVMLWILIALSPFAFVLKILHKTEHYAEQWWSQFGNNVISGPIIAFFLWLSFVTVGSGTIHDEIKQNNALDRGLTLETVSPEEETVGITSITSWDKMANFILAVATLIAAAKVAGELGVAGAGMMSSAAEAGKRAAMVASGYSAARWLVPKVGKGLYYGSAMVPGLNAVHPERWKQRVSRLKSRASQWYDGRMIKGTLKAKDIAETLKVDPKTGKYMKKGKVQKRDDHGEVVVDENGNPVMVDGKVEQGGFFSLDGLKRLGAVLRLETGSGFGDFHKAITEDEEAAAEASHERRDHYVSTSSLPVGFRKQSYKEELKTLEHTGHEIKAGKEAVMDQRREEIMHAIKHEEEEIEKIKNDAALSKDEKAKQIAKIKQHTIEDLEKKGLDSTQQQLSRALVDRFDKAMESKAKAEVIGANVKAEHEKEEVKGLEEYLKKEGSEIEAKTAELKAANQQSKDVLATEKELEELKAIKKLLGGEGKDTQQVIIDTRAEIANFKEVSDIESEEQTLRARAANYLVNKEEDKAEAFSRRADSLGLEKSREATKNLTGDELAARAGYLAARLAQARKDNDEVAINNLVKKLAVARSTAMTQAAWIGPMVDRVIEKAIGMTAEAKKDMTAQQYNLSLDLGRKNVPIDEVADSAKELEDRLGGPDKNQAYLRDRRLAVESALEKSRREVAGTVDSNYVDGKVQYRVVNLVDKGALQAKSDSEYTSWSKKVDLSTSAGAPISNLGRDSDGVILEHALETCKKEMDIFVAKLAGMTANQFNRIPKIIEDLQKSDDKVKRAIVDMVQNTKGANKQFVEQLKGALKVQ